MLAITKLGNICFKKPPEIPFLEEKDYKDCAEDALQKAVDLIESDGWKKEKISGDDIIFTKVVPDYGKVFKFEGTLHMSPADVIDHIYFKIEDMYKWNPTVKKVRILQKIDENIDVAHVIAAEGAAGLVASRDFVNVRIWKKTDGGGYIHGTVGTTHSDVPPSSKYVRGEQGPGAYIVTPESENSCKLKWLLNTNLKGWIPQYLIDQTLSSVMIDYIQSLRRHNAKTKSNV